VWIDKADSDEKRPLGIPVMEDRACQTLVKEALEPEWEARFEANSYGFRPGRSCHDAVAAIFTAITRKAKYVLDADIAKCFDKIDHQALLAKVNASPSVLRQINAWLKAGVLDGPDLFPTEEGTMQGGTISPLLDNIALHGLETTIIQSFPPRKGFNPPIVVRYADDFVVLHADQQVIEQCTEVARTWLKPIGLELKPSKTRLAHTLQQVQGKAGFDFLGFNIRQYVVGRHKSGKDSRGKLLGFKTLTKPSLKAIGKHVKRLREIIHNHKGAAQELLIFALNPVSRGWARYYSKAASKRIFQRLDHTLFLMLRPWANRRHPNKGQRWCANRYWSRNARGRKVFQPSAGRPQLFLHGSSAYSRHVKVQGRRSPYDGDWIYWSSRRGRSPDVEPRVAKLLRKQAGRCFQCRLYFRDGDQLEVAHNLMLLHHHCLNESLAS
jgi:RNA-directed DNA polymerase